MKLFSTICHSFKSKYLDKTIVMCILCESNLPWSENGGVTHFSEKFPLS